MLEIAMPRLSDSMEEGTIAAWLVRDGDEIAAGQDIVEIESDKATSVYASGAAGTVQIVADAGVTLRIGAVIARVGDPSSLLESATVEQPKAASGPAPATVRTPTETRVASRRVRASPVARRVANELSFDLEEIVGTGPSGRITKADVVAAATAEPSPTRIGSAAEVRHRQPTRTEELVAARMVRSCSEIPQYSVSTDIDVTQVLAFRGELKTLVNQGTRHVPSVNDLFVKAIGLALRAHPRLNSAWTDKGIAEYDLINIGVAVATDDGGLVVPVIRQADLLSLGALADVAVRLIGRARAGRCHPADFEGATFTLSNLGMFGVRDFTSIVTPGQGAILSIGAATQHYANVEGSAPPRMRLTATLSSDHRVIYGAHAAAFLADLRALLEHPAGLAL